MRMFFFVFFLHIISQSFCPIEMALLVSCRKLKFILKVWSIISWIWIVFPFFSSPFIHLDNSWELYRFESLWITSFWLKTAFFNVIKLYLPIVTWIDSDWDLWTESLSTFEVHLNALKQDDNFCWRPVCVTQCWVFFFLHFNLLLSWKIDIIQRMKDDGHLTKLTKNFLTMLRRI